MSAFRGILEVAIAEHICNGCGSEEFFDSLDDSALMWIPMEDYIHGLTASNYDIGRRARQLSTKARI
jgi:hypothetical protein